MGEAERIAVVLGGRPVGTGRWLCRCPAPDHGKGRGDLNPSLSISDGDEALLVNCFAGCDRPVVLDALRQRGLLAEEGRPTRPADHWPRPRLVTLPDAAAVAIWRDAEPAGNRVRIYLRRRGINLDPPPSLRQGTSFRFGGPAPRPTLVAAVQSPAGRVIASQETCLTWDGRKAPVKPVRRMSGALGVGAVRLGPAAETLGLCEGLETGLSVMQLYGISCWAVLGARRLSRVALPRAVERVVVFGDNDTAGRAAAMSAVKVYAAAQLKVEVRLPPDSCNDFNDLLIREAGL